MVTLLIILTYLFGFLAALAGIFFGATFTNPDRVKFPILTVLDERRLLVFKLLVIFSFLAFITGLGKELLTASSPVEVGQSVGGRPLSKQPAVGLTRKWKTPQSRNGMRRVIISK